MYTPNLVSILFYDQPLSIFKFDDVMPTSRIAGNGVLLSKHSLGILYCVLFSLQNTRYLPDDRIVLSTQSYCCLGQESKITQTGSFAIINGVHFYNMRYHRVT